MELIESERAPSGRRGRGRDRRAVVGAVAVVAGVVGAVVAVVVVSGAGDGADAVPGSGRDRVEPPALSVTTTAPAPVPPPGGRLVPDPEEAAWVEALTDYRQTIDAESLQCFGPDAAPMPMPELPGERWMWSGLHGVALADLMTVDLMTAECADRYWYPADRTDAGAQTCIRGSAPVVPPVVVALDGLTCADAAGDGVALRPLADDDLVELNRLRAIEIGLLAVPYECATVEQTTAWVEGVLTEERLDLAVHVHDEPMIEHGDTEPTQLPACPYHSRVDWAEQVVYVEPFHS